MDALALDRAFAALAHPTRRALLQRFGRGSTGRAGDLAEPFNVTLIAVSKHLRVLDETGLVDRKAVGRERRYAARADGLGPALSWLLAHHEFWTTRLDALAAAPESRGKATEGARDQHADGWAKCAERMQALLD